MGLIKMAFEEIFATINFTFDTAFSPILIFSPMFSLLIVSGVITILVLVIQRIFINKNMVKQIKQNMEEIREKLTTAQKAGNNEEAKKFLGELMKTNSDYMKHSFKALIVSLVVISLFLPWLKYRFEGVPVASLPFSLPFIGASLDWLLWYILVSVTVGWVIKKLFAIDYM